MSGKIEGVVRISRKVSGGNQGVFPEILDVGTISVNSRRIRILCLFKENQLKAMSFSNDERKSGKFKFVLMSEQ